MVYRSVYSLRYRSFQQVVLVSAILAVLLCGGLAASTGEEKKQIRLVAWNIEWFPGKWSQATAGEAEQHMKLVQGELSRIRPDVFIGTEMRDWRAFDQAVSAVPGLKPVVVSAFRSSRDTGFWPMQIGIASRHPVEAAWWEPWRPTLADNPRGFSLAVLYLGDGGGVVLIYGLHLKSNRANDENQARLNHLMREESVIQLLAHIDEMERLAFPDRVRGVVVAGDLNTNHDGQFGDETISLLEGAGFYNTFTGVPRERRLTWRGSSQFEPTTFDYIFTKGLGNPQALMITVSDDASDHFPVGVVLDLPK